MDIPEPRESVRTSQSMKEDDLTYRYILLEHKMDSMREDVKDLKEMLRSQHRILNEQIDQTHTKLEKRIDSVEHEMSNRIKAIDNRIWAIMFSSLVAVIGVLFEIISNSV